MIASDYTALYEAFAECHECRQARRQASDRSGGQLITACANYGGQERLDTCGQAHSLERLQQAWDVRTDRAPAIQEEAELDRDHAERKLALKHRGPPRRGGNTAAANHLNRLSFQQVPVISSRQTGVKVLSANDSSMWNRGNP